MRGRVQENVWRSSFTLSGSPARDRKLKLELLTWPRPSGALIGANRVSRENAENRTRDGCAPVSAQRQEEEQGGHDPDGGHTPNSGGFVLVEYQAHKREHKPERCGNENSQPAKG